MPSRHRLAAVALVIAGFASTVRGVRADDQLSPAILDRLKASTVFIQINGNISGSGFFVRRTGTKGLIATNAHVVAPRGVRADDIIVILNSGTSAERKLKAVATGIDHGLDLAFLNVEASDLPLPISLKTKIERRETMPVYIAGFPFGEALAGKGQFPAITIVKGSISSIRLNQYGAIDKIQIDGGLHPGNSGGPIVNVRGELVGVAVSAILGTNIGMAIPPEHLREAMAGRIVRATFNALENEQGAVKIGATISLIDPFKKIKSVSVLLTRASDIPEEPQPDADGNWKQIKKKMKQYALKLEDSKAEGEFVIKSKTGKDIEYFFQIKHRCNDNKVFFTEPSKFVVPFGEGTKNVLVDISKEKKSKDEKEEGDDWLGGTEEKRRQRAAANSEPLVLNKPLAAKEEIVVDAKTTSALRDQQSRFCDAVWSANGTFVYVLEEHGLLRKISLNSFKEICQFDIGYKCSALQRSAQGLVVLVQGAEEIWVFEPKQLKLVRKIKAPKIQNVLSAPSLNHALAFTSDQRNLSFIDLRRRRIGDRH